MVLNAECDVVSSGLGNVRQAAQHSVVARDFLPHQSQFGIVIAIEEKITVAHDDAIFRAKLGLKEKSVGVLVLALVDSIEKRGENSALQVDGAVDALIPHFDIWTLGDAALEFRFRLRALCATKSFPQVQSFGARKSVGIEIVRLFESVVSVNVPNLHVNRVFAAVKYFRIFCLVTSQFFVLIGVIVRVVIVPLRPITRIILFLGLIFIIKIVIQSLVPTVD